jgi:hypothetical protein
MQPNNNSHAAAVGGPGAPATQPQLQQAGGAPNVLVVPMQPQQNAGGGGRGLFTMDTLMRMLNGARNFAAAAVAAAPAAAPARRERPSQEQQQAVEPEPPYDVQEDPFIEIALGRLRDLDNCAFEKTPRDELVRVLQQVGGTSRAHVDRAVHLLRLNRERVIAFDANTARLAKQLSEMGFDEQAAANALRRNNNNPDAAVVALTEAREPFGATA